MRSAGHNGCRRMLCHTDTEKPQEADEKAPLNWGRGKERGDCERHRNPALGIVPEDINAIMKITLIGAAGVRTPLLVHGLAGLGGSVGLDGLAFLATDP